MKGQKNGKKGLFTMKWLIASSALFIGVSYVINRSPIGLAGLHAITGGATILDMSFGYTPDEAYRTLEALGEAGRAFDLRYILPVDMIFPLAYGLFYFIALTMAAKSVFRNMKRPYRIGTVGIAACFFDLLENAMIFMLLSRYPARADDLAAAANFFTLCKWFFNFAAMAGIVLGSAVTAVLKIRSRASGKA